jgi:hypothetical protein
VYLQTTQKARNALGIANELLQPPMQTASVLGNWLLNVVPLGGRHAFIFMSGRSLLSFPLMIGKLQPLESDMPAFLSHGLGQLTLAMGVSHKQIARLLEDFDQLDVCKATDKPLLGAFSAIAADYNRRANAQAGVVELDIDAIVAAVNSTPRQMLGFQTSFEVSQKLLLSGNA